MWIGGSVAASLLVAFCILAQRATGQKFDALQVRYGTQEERQSKKAFIEMPLTKTEAESQSFVPVPGSTECKGKFAGFRYWKNGDRSVILLFDNSGRVAGIQTAFPRSKITSDIAKKWIQRQGQTGLIQDDTVAGVDTYTITAYFYDPSTVCSKATRGGNRVDRFSFQSGARPRQNLHVPSREAQLNAKSGAAPLWNQGLCYPQMGMHYFYNISKDMSSEEFLPLSLMYHEGRLVACTFVFMGNFTNDNYEHLTKKAIPDFFGPRLPKFFLGIFDDIQGYTTMHVYLNDPQNIACSKA